MREFDAFTSSAFSFVVSIFLLTKIASLRDEIYSVIHKQHENFGVAQSNNVLRIEKPVYRQPRVINLQSQIQFQTFLYVVIIYITVVTST